MLSAILPAIVLAGAGFGKVTDPVQTGVFLNTALGLPFALAVLAGRLTGCAELTLALLLIIGMGRSLLPAMTGIGLMCAFFSLLVYLAATVPNVTCGCFGAILGIWFPKSVPSQMSVDVAVILMLTGHLAATRSLMALVGEYR